MTIINLSNQNTSVNPLRVALYCRVSTSEQANEGVSLDAQLAGLRVYSQLHKWEIVDEYVDGGYSGSDDNRPELKRLINDAHSHRFQIIATAKLDRFFRNLRLLVNYLHDFEDLDITFISTSENLDSSTPMGKFAIQMFGIIAEFERQRISERCKDARKFLTSQSRWSSGRTPYGYRFSKVTKELEVYEPEAEVVKFIFNSYAGISRGTILSITKILNEQDYLSPRSGRRKSDYWRDSAVHHILKHPGYYGGPNEFWPYKSPVIIDKTIWDEAQRRLVSNRRFKESKSHSSYQGLLKCGLCGHSLRMGYSGIGVKRKRYWECPGRLRRNHFDGSAPCTLKRLPAEQFESGLTTKLDKDIFSSPEHFKRYLVLDIKRIEVEKTALECRIKPVKSKIDKFKNQLDVLDAKLEVGRISKVEYKASVRELQAKIRQLDKQTDASDVQLLNNIKAYESLQDVEQSLIQELNKPGVTLPYFNRKIEDPFIADDIREQMLKLGLICYVNRDHVELKGSLRQSVISPTFRRKDSRPSIPIAIRLPLPKELMEVARG